MNNRTIKQTHDWCILPIHMSYVRVITEPLYIIITMAIPRNTSVHVQSKKALQEALDGFVWTLTNAESHGTTHTQKPEEIKAGEIEAQFNGAVNHFHRYQRLLDYRSLIKIPLHQRQADYCQYQEKRQSNQTYKVLLFHCS